MTGDLIFRRCFGCFVGRTSASVSIQGLKGPTVTNRYIGVVHCSAVLLDGSSVANVQTNAIQ